MSVKTFKKNGGRPVTFALDYGTSNSLLAATDGNFTTEPLALDQDASDPTVFRSVMYFANGQSCFYGQRAINEYTDAQGEGRLIRSIKKYLPSESYVGSWIDDRMVRLEDLISYFLLEMKKRAEIQIERDVDSIVLGRPAKFSHDPIKDKLAQYRLEKAAGLAGFKNVSFLPEPLAAAFDLRRKLKEMKTVLVVDLGGGTSDFTVIRIGPEAFKEEDVLAIGGVSIAGDAVDGEFMKIQVAPYFGSKVKYRVPMGNNILEMPKSLLDHICTPADIAQLRRSDHFDFFKSVQSWAPSAKDKQSLERLFVLVDDQLGFRLFEEIDRTKRALGEKQIAPFEFDYPQIEIAFDVHDVDFNMSIAHSSEQILKCMDETLRDAQVTAEEIDLVYCTGGTSKLALIQKGLQQRFKNQFNDQNQSKIVRSDFFHSVIQGLAARAAELIV